MIRKKPGIWPAIRRLLLRHTRTLALVMMGVAALFGIPIIIDPPPQDRVAESQDADGRGTRPKRRGKRKAS